MQLPGDDMEPLIQPVNVEIIDHVIMQMTASPMQLGRTACSLSCKIQVVVQSHAPETCIQ